MESLRRSVQAHLNATCRPFNLPVLDLLHVHLEYISTRRYNFFFFPGSPKDAAFLFCFLFSYSFSAVSLLFRFHCPRSVALSPTGVRAPSENETCWTTGILGRCSKTLELECRLRRVATPPVCSVACSCDTISHCPSTITMRIGMKSNKESLFLRMALPAVYPFFASVSFHCDKRGSWSCVFSPACLFIAFSSSPHTFQCTFPWEVYPRHQPSVGAQRFTQKRSAALWLKLGSHASLDYFVH